MKTVVFDLDGTLADTSADLIAAANACFLELGHGRLLDPEADKLTAFHGGRAMLQLGFSRLDGAWGDSDADAEYPNFLDSYGENIDRETRLYPGAREAVERLLGDGYACSVCTNKPEGFARELLKRLGVNEMFGALIGADTLPVRKPDPLPYRTAVEAAGGSVAASCLIGDTETDVKTARAAGVPVVLVRFGPEGEAIARLKPDAMLDHYDDLATIVTDLIG
ncbi:MAG: HAD-IA family hydrolase [Boseongicola sp.]